MSTRIPGSGHSFSGSDTRDPFAQVGVERGHGFLHRTQTSDPSAVFRRYPFSHENSSTYLGWRAGGRWEVVSTRDFRFGRPTPVEVEEVGYPRCLDAQ
eukprot:scaffold48317_cov65-Cyclotella_meneghiniana.AAC.1